MRNEGGVFFSSGQSEASASDPEVQADRKNNGTQGRDKDRGAGSNSNHLHFQQPLRFSVPSNRNDKGINCKVYLQIFWRRGDLSKDFKSIHLFSNLCETLSLLLRKPRDNLTILLWNIIRFIIKMYKIYRRLTEFGQG